MCKSAIDARDGFPKDSSKLMISVASDCCFSRAIANSEMEYTSALVYAVREAVKVGSRCAETCTQIIYVVFFISLEYISTQFRF